MFVPTQGKDNIFIAILLWRIYTCTPWRSCYDSEKLLIGLEYIGTMLAGGSSTSRINVEPERQQKKICQLLTLAMRLWVRVPYSYAPASMCCLLFRLLRAARSVASTTAYREHVADTLVKHARIDYTCISL